MDSGKERFLKGLEGVVSDRHLTELRDIFAGNVGPEGMAAALARISGRIAGNAPPDPREELALVRDWAAVPDNLARRCWISRREA